MDPNKGEKSRFPKLEDCAHFHYEITEIGPLKATLLDDKLCPKSPRRQRNVQDDENGDSFPNSVYSVEVTSNDKTWIVRRSLENFALLDEQLHKCIYDRRYSKLPEINRFTKGRQTGFEEEQENVPPEGSDAVISVIEKVGLE